jgi:hypothetical protein
MCAFCWYRIQRPHIMKLPITFTLWVYWFYRSSNGIWNIDWLVSFGFFCLLNDLSVLGLKYVSHIGHANVQCSCMVLETLTWLWVIFLWTDDLSGSSLIMSYHHLWLPSNKILTVCSPETDLLKPKLQMGKLSVWPFEASYSLTVGVSAGICPSTILPVLNQFALLRLCHRIYPI